jgi:hypothetical protein
VSLLFEENGCPEIAVVDEVEVKNTFLLENGDLHFFCQNSLRTRPHFNLEIRVVAT